MKFRGATKNSHSPAPGRLRLTDDQIADIDNKLSSLCAFTEETGGEGKLTIIVRRGKIRFWEMTTSGELSPVWSEAR